MTIDWVGANAWAWGYLALGVAVLIAAWWFGWDADIGGYNDRYFLESPDGKVEVAPDKAQHAAISFVLTFLAAWLMPLLPAAAITLLLGAGWEAQQEWPRKVWSPSGRGFGSLRDIAADASGVAAALILHLVIRGLWILIR